MAYDLEPLVTLATKKILLARAAREEWQLVFYHDPVVSRARVAPDAAGGYVPSATDVMSDG
jgi:hypothetical protein